MPTIKKPNQYFDATVFTGTGATLSVTNAGAFKPDFVWIKDRLSGNHEHMLFDSVRGATNYLRTNTTAAEQTVGTTLTAFNSNGFTVGSGADSNPSGNTAIAWQWQAGSGTTTVNTSGSISSNVSVNTTAGFSVVTYTGTGANATVGHGLGVAPAMIIIKSRSGVTDWPVYHASVGNTKALFLNKTIAADTSISYWNNNSPTSSVFNIGYGADVNPSSANIVAYCWAEIAGFSKFGSYTGNGSTDGPFVYLGFRPKFILFKVTSEVNGWVIYDTSRDTYNYMGSQLYPHLSNVETVNAAYAIDATANGFKIRTSNGVINVSSGTFIYAAFAEAPFKYANAR